MIIVEARFHNVSALQVEFELRNKFPDLPKGITYHDIYEFGGGGGSPHQQELIARVPPQVAQEVISSFAARSIHEEAHEEIQAAIDAEETIPKDSLANLNASNDALSGLDLSAEHEIAESV